MKNLELLKESKIDTEVSSIILSSIKDLKSKKIDAQKANAIAKLANSFTRNELMRVAKVKVVNQIVKSQQERAAKKSIAKA